MIVWVIIWVLCGAIAAMIASERGGSGVLGFVLGVLLGPFGIAIAFFIGGEKEKAALQIGAGERKKCPMCAELVQPEAVICKHCQHEFRPAAAEAQSE